MKIEFRFNKILIILIIILSICSINSFVQCSMELNKKTNTFLISDENNSQKVSYDIAWEKEYISGIYTLDISSDGKVIAIASAGIIYIFDNNGKIIWSSSKNGVGGVIKLSPEGNCLVSQYATDLHLFPDYIDKPLWIIKENDINILDIDVSSNCSSILVLNRNGKIYLINNNRECV